MKYTKEQLQAMSDFEVNKALALLVDDFEDPPADCATEIIGDKLFYRDRSHGSYFECHKGYCDEANDIMPLAFEHKVCLISPQSHTKTWSARQTDGGGLWSVSDYFYLDANPLRAIACCLILVLQGEKE